MALMRVETPKQRKWSQDLLDKATEFHGHSGPLMVVGLRMGLMALEKLDANGWFDLSCRARLYWGPPDSCILDGIQISTGCTIGKHNIEVEDHDGIVVEFTKGDRILDISLRPKVFERIRGTLASKNEGVVKSIMSEVAEASEGDIFKITLTP
jgi:formylmethanofuran dehydrogenase subunit E